MPLVDIHLSDLKRSVVHIRPKHTVIAVVKTKRSACPIWIGGCDFYTRRSGCYSRGDTATVNHEKEESQENAKYQFFAHNLILCTSSYIGRITDELTCCQAISFYDYRTETDKGG
ncbi:MAG: hypothetical protein WBB69_09585 [Anaerolineales bacterium]